MSKLTEHLDALQARANAASEGPWLREDGLVYIPYKHDIEQIHLYICEVGDHGVKPEQIAADTNFIAESRTTVPALIEAFNLSIQMTDAMIEARWRGLYKDPTWNDEAIAKDKSERDAELLKILEAAK